MKQALLVFLCSLCSYGMAQEWKTTETRSGDTLVQTQIYVNEKGEKIEDSTQTHKIVSKYRNYYLLNWERFRLDGTAAEDERGVHRKVMFLKKFFKFYNKNQKPLRWVRDAYHYEQGNATYCIFKYNERGDLIEVRFYRDKVERDPTTGIIVRNRLNAIEAYEGMVHRYQFKYFWNRKILKEYAYSIKNEFIDKRVFVGKRVNKKRKKKKNRSALKP
ncbi:hypothetical protein [Aureispira anguillae]|uniref:Uncharacterized protein n=1 Tax=Aureispira anguillae TaxID=2864201 RepID=A0A915YB95_9BACT|nr:hypothetical protein [Aureispira anguillae]BDS09902.1 hypothetical protein AsAng_0006070 [Aureispira anguillae]